MDLISGEDLQERLESLHGWEGDTESIAKTFMFADFAAAMAFMQSAAPKIDELNHHPDWSNVYNRVNVQLATHDAGGVTELDIKLAALLDALAAG